MNRDEVIVPDNKKWEFDENVTQVFDDMLERSIPQYDVMRELTNKIGMNYVQEGTAIFDLGCSNGNAIEPFVKKFGVRNRYVLLDVSEPMLKACKDKYLDYVLDGIVDIQKYDITKGLPQTYASVILSVLTLQFTPIEYRQNIVDEIYKRLAPNGAFLFVEKVLGNGAEIDKVLVDEYYGLKEENNYTQEQIQNKRKSLEGVLVPITSKWNEDMLYNAGFRSVDCYWRYLNFCGWIAIK